MGNSARNLLIIAVSFGLYYVFDDLFFRDLRELFFEQTNQLGISHIIAYVITGIPLFAGAYLIGPGASFFNNLGLDKSIVQGFSFAVICTLPMFVGFSIILDFNDKLSADTILIGVVSAGFFEELYFRGFLFGLAFKKTKLGFLLSVLVGSAYFASLHLYQSSELIELTGIFLITFIGGILFAWIYAEWDFNIWIPVFAHMLMNLAWEIFSVSNSALGGIYPNIFRFLTVFLLIILTILYKNWKGTKFEVNKRTLLLKGQK